MQIVMVEDEFMVAKRLKRFIADVWSLREEQVKHFVTLDDARDYLADHIVDLVFLDLNLNGSDGFELLKEQVSGAFHTIVVSANTDRAIEAFEFGVVDFIAKPFTKERLQKAHSRLQHDGGHKQTKFLSYKQLGRLEILAVEQVNYLKASGHYTEINTLAGDTVLHDKSLEKLMSLLSTSFVRIHKSYGVALSQLQSIKSYEGSRYEALLKDGSCLPIGRTRYPAIKKMLG